MNNNNGVYSSRGRKLCALALESLKVELERTSANNDLDKEYNGIEETNTLVQPPTSQELDATLVKPIENQEIIIEINDPELKTLIESEGLTYLLNIQNESNLADTYGEEIVSENSNLIEKSIPILEEEQNNLSNIQNEVVDPAGELYQEEIFEEEIIQENLNSIEIPVPLSPLINEKQSENQNILLTDGGDEYEDAQESEEVLFERISENAEEFNEIRPEREDDLHEENSGRPKKGRKRKFPEQTRIIKKLKVNTNQDYITTKGEVKFSKEFREYICNCRMKCTDRVPVEMRNVTFQNFQKAGTFEGRYQIIQGLVKEVPIKRKRAKESNVKTTSREYYICDKVVCKSMFQQTLRVSSCVVDRALKLKRNNTIVCDGRGKAGGHNKTSEEKINLVMRHISKFPRYKSHYCRSKTDSKYLNSDVTLKVMHDLYTQENPENPVSKELYKKVFLSKFNLKRKPLKKDTCNVCDTLVAQMKHFTGEQLDDAKAKHETHIKLAEEARKYMNEQFLHASEDNSKECLSFDLEKTLPLPRIPTNIVYYKRQLCFYNCGVHDSKKKGFCYTWVEGTAGRGSQEVSSCLRKHILLNVSNETTHLDLWSDSCGGQNRNIKMVLMMKTVLESHASLKSITQSFLVPGHTFLKNDSDFSDIECSLKLQARLYTADDYVDVIKKCRKKNPLFVTKMVSEDFLGTKDLENSITNRKVSVEGLKINWLKFRVIEVRKENPMSIFVKKDFNEENYTEINIFKKKGRKSLGNEGCFFSSKLTPLWPNGKPISEAKLADLKSMFSFIPRDCLSFYKKLTASTAGVEDDIEGFGGDLDFELESEEL